VKRFLTIFFLFTFFATNQLKAQLLDLEEKNLFSSVKLGNGIPYGNFGLMSEIGYYKNSVIIGIGMYTPKGGGVNYSLGWRLYHAEPKRSFRAKGGINVGVTDNYLPLNASRYLNVFGISLSGGVVYTFQGFIIVDVEIVIPVKQGKNSDKKKPSPGLGIGINTSRPLKVFYKKQKRKADKKRRAKEKEKKKKQKKKDMDAPIF